QLAVGLQLRHEFAQGPVGHGMLRDRFHGLGGGGRAVTSGTSSRAKAWAGAPNPVWEPFQSCTPDLETHAYAAEHVLRRSSESRRRGETGAARQVQAEADRG